MDRIGTIRAMSLYLPLTVTVLLWLRRRPFLAERAGILLACIWNFDTLLLVHRLASHFDWWTFRAEKGLFLGMPVDLYLGWALLWGAIPPLAFPRPHTVTVAMLALWFDLLAMPLLAPVLQLGREWLFGEAAAIGICLIPARLLAAWTAEKRRLSERTFLQILAFTGLMAAVIPAAILEQTGGDWRRLLARPSWMNSVGLQLLAIPAVMGLSAVQEFVARGKGTPLPYDPPLRLVTSGPYAYVRNPMQVSAVLLLLGWGILLGSPWVAAAGLMAHIYSIGLAGWDETESMRHRFGTAWSRYRNSVRAWIPRWRPWHPAADGGPDPRRARLYVAVSCLPCSQIKNWFERRCPVGMIAVAAEDHPDRDLYRITYEPGDGGPEEEGVAALGRGLEHIHLGYAFIGWTMRLPVVRQFLQLIADVSGGEPRRVRRNPRRNENQNHEMVLSRKR